MYLGRGEPTHPAETLAVFGHSGISLIQYLQIGFIGLKGLGV